MTKRKIYFRADASAKIGYGHFTRTLALADMLKDDFDCTFFTQSPTDYQKAEVSKVCKLEILPADESRFNLFIEILKGDEIVVLDNYFFTTNYQQQIKNKGCRLICIDDMHDKHYIADVVINHGIEDPTIFDVESYTQLCLGLEWALLRKDFLQTNDFNTKEAGHWLIAFGGSDFYNLTEKFVRLLHDKNEVNRISVVVGDAYSYIHSLKKYSKIDVRKNLTAYEMATLMQKCEYAILPSSGICIEALSRNCKILSGYYVDNQKGFYNYLTKQKLILPLGDLCEIEKIPCFKKNFAGNNQIEFSLIPLKYRLLFNGFSPPFIDNELSFIDYLSLPLDKHYDIWRARNHDEIRKHMDSSDMISWESHCKFINRLFTNKQKRYWAVYNNNLIGSINISYITETKVERGIFIVPEQFGKSWGTKIEKATDKLLQSLGISEIEAKVLHSNTNSLYFHYKNHYFKYSNDEKYEYLIKKLQNG